MDLAELLADVDRESWVPGAVLLAPLVLLVLAPALGLGLLSTGGHLPLALGAAAFAGSIAALIVASLVAAPFGGLTHSEDEDGLDELVARGWLRRSHTIAKWSVRVVVPAVVLFAGQALSAPRGALVAAAAAAALLGPTFTGNWVTGFAGKPGSIACLPMVFASAAASSAALVALLIAG